MPPVPVVPDSLAALTSLLRPCFTAPSFDIFCWLVVGFISQVGERTVCGMWQAARLAEVFHHSRARWQPKVEPLPGVERQHRDLQALESAVLGEIEASPLGIALLVLAGPT